LGARREAAVSLPGQEPPTSTPNAMVTDGAATGQQSQLARFTAASAGHFPDLADDYEAAQRPRIGLAPRAALAGVMALLTLGGGVAAAYAWSDWRHEDVAGVTVGNMAAAWDSSALALTGGAASDPVTALGAQLPGEDGLLSASAAVPMEVVVEAPKIVVHVAGEVVAPGVVTLDEGARVADAIAGVGGATPDAQLEAINLARVLVDGEQIKVPKIGDEPLTPVDQPPDGDEGGGTAESAGAADDGGKINLNTADATQLQQLPGIGPALAGRIVTYREENGGFGTIDQLQEVKGIGPAVMGNIAGLVTVG